ncbi:hypothetical protein HBH88_048910 [Parastagonospora nodorum]|nr:hypothetical protein HBH42_051260 [Parastagonospora nodorum]KAH4505891.1 hypothetical protein HBH88_048910 [Parastagonospora nodorum]KAH4536273.1 hypothetical protein HBH87_005950 [Parastagonospora nodorum]KAH4837365.1 hypothetical protein HBH60_006160 [Parastagonospora nodorum]KAH4992063.1 hypothetical protein HBI76_045700 [Parastagonospora nodorum]
MKSDISSRVPFAFHALVFVRESRGVNMANLPSPVAISGLSVVTCAAKGMGDEERPVAGPQVFPIPGQ